MGTDTTSQEHPPAEPEVSAWRVTFEYEGGETRVVAQQRVQMLAPPDDAELLARGTAGYWVEVRDSEGRTLYRQVLHTPIRDEHEVFSPEPGVSPRHVTAVEPKGVFQVVVPDLPEGHEILLHGRSSTKEVATRAARRLAKARLREMRPGGKA